MGENTFVLLKSEQKFTCELKAASAPWDGLEMLVAVSLWLCFAATLGCAAPSLPRQCCPRNQEEPCALFRGPRAVTVPLYSRYLWRSLPCSQAPQPTLSFLQQKSSSWLGIGERDPAALYHRKNVKIVCFNSQHLRVFLLIPFLFSSPCYFCPFFLLLFFLFFAPACSISVVAVAVFPFLHPVTSAHCVSLSFFLLPARFRLFISQPFCFCSLIISFLPVLSPVLHSHPSTRSLPLIILLFFAAVSFNAFFDTAYSLMIIRRSGDAGAMNFTNPALRASVHNHSSRSTGAES